MKKKKFNDNKMSLCEKDCKYNGYILANKKANCTCNIKIEIPILSNISNIVINKEKLIYNFMNVKKSLNLEIMKCLNNLFSKDCLKNNIGNYIILSILLINIVNNILFICKGYKSLAEIIDNIIIKKQSLYYKIEENKIKKNTKEKKDKKFKENKDNKKNKDKNKENKENKEKKKKKIKNNIMNLNKQKKKYIF